MATSEGQAGKRPDAPASAGAFTLIVSVSHRLRASVPTMWDLRPTRSAGTRPSTVTRWSKPFEALSRQGHEVLPVDQDRDNGVIGGLTVEDVEAWVQATHQF